MLTSRRYANIIIIILLLPRFQRSYSNFKRQSDLRTRNTEKAEMSARLVPTGTYAAVLLAHSTVPCLQSSASRALTRTLRIRDRNRASFLKLAFRVFPDFSVQRRWDTNFTTQEEHRIHHSPRHVAFR